MGTRLAPDPSSHFFLSVIAEKYFSLTGGFLDFLRQEKAVYLYFGNNPMDCQRTLKKQMHSVTQRAKLGFDMFAARTAKTFGELCNDVREHWSI